MASVHRTGIGPTTAAPVSPAGVLGVVWVVGVVTLGGAGCSGGAHQVPIKGETRAVDTLAGVWKGEYIGVDSGRRGTIEFSLTVGRHTADGEVVMYPREGGAEPRALRIQFVEVEEGGSVRGKIAPYADPQCSCQVEAEFLGRVAGDEMEGTFETRVIGTERVQSGRWSVRRSES